MSKSYCVSIDLVGGLRLPDSELDRFLIDDDGNPLTAAAARQLFVQKLREGFDVLPICDNHDVQGHCQGHETVLIEPIKE